MTLLIAFTMCSISRSKVPSKFGRSIFRGWSRTLSLRTAKLQRSAVF
jgi:hypothetical protein